MNIHNLSRPILAVYCFALVPIYTWLAFFGHVPYVYTSILLLAALAGYGALSHVLSRRGRDPTLRIPINQTMGFAAASLSLISIWIFYNFAAGDKVDAAGRSMFSTNLGLLANYIAWLGIGVAIGNGFKWNEGSIRAALSVSWIILSLFFAMQIDITTGAISFASETSEKKSMYLLFADFYAVSALLAIAVMRGSKLPILIFIISSAMLFVLQSRASLFFFAFTFVAFNVLSRSFRAKLGVTVAFAAILIAIPLVDLSQIGAAGRMTVFFDRGLTGDASFLGRMQLLQEGISTIANNPVLGSYNSLVANGSVTSYIHNILSYWQLYGFIVFALMFFLLVISPGKYIVKNLLAKRQNAMPAYVKATSLISLFVIIQILTARAYVWHFSWLLVGLMAVRSRDLQWQEIETIEGSSE